MSNPIIDAIVWNPVDPTASSILLQTQLAALQAEWDTKTSRFLQLTSVGAKSDASFLDLPNHRSDEIDLYTGLDPSIPAADSTLRMVRGQLQATLPYAGVGHTERVYLAQSSVLVPNAAVNTTFLYSQTIVLPRPAYVRGWHPLVLKSAGANPCSNLFRPQIDNVAIFSGNPTGGITTDPRPGITFWPSILNVESYSVVEWSTVTPIAAGSHSFRMDIIAGAFFGGALSAANVAPFFDLYTSAIEVGTMPTTYVQPSVSYLEFIYT